jgi:hypothetical protein
MAVGVAVTVINIAVGTYFVAMIVFAIDTYRFFSIPFLLLFVAGYTGPAGARSVKSNRAVRWLKQRRLELKTAREPRSKTHC